MSLENEEHHSLDQPAVTNKESQKKSRISYTRDFLLSLSELDVCKKLPPGFDLTILSDFEDTSQDRQRIPGTFSAFRRNEYGSSPPTRGDSGNYSRGVQGRWESRSSARSDRDSDSQSDWDSDSGRRYGNQSRRSWQGPEHDGLLGSGSFPRPSGYSAGASAPKVRANDQYHLNRSNEPYHPPRPYKAVPYSRRETDSYNDETFGSTECSEDRAEEERKRRASFESWRKEQQKAFQEKKMNSETHKDDFDISELLVDSKDEKGLINRSKESDESIPVPNIDSDKSYLPSQTPASRPLVPPGFTSTMLERKVGTKTSNHSQSSQVVSTEVEGSQSEAKGNLLFNGTSDDRLGKQSKQNAEENLSEQQLQIPSIDLSANNKSGKAVNVSASDKSNEATSMDSQMYKTSSLSEALEAPGSIKVTELDSMKLPFGKVMGETEQDSSTSILDKLFGSALTPSGGGSSNFTEHNDSNADETWPAETSPSSKFAHLFFDEDKTPLDDLSTDKPKDLLSLIQGGERYGPHASDGIANMHVPASFPFQISELVDRHAISNLVSPGNESSELSCTVNDLKPEAAPAILTCEDLEKSILLESTENGPTLPPAAEGWELPDSEAKVLGVNVDDHASHHLLSLLQKGTNTENIILSTNLDIRSSERIQSIETTNANSASHELTEANVENATSSGKTLTLEALFGSAFMKELQSVGSPASVQRGSIESARVDILESNTHPLITEDSVLPSTVHIGSSRSNFETNISPFTQREQIKSDGIEEQLLGYKDSRSAVDSSYLQAELGSKFSVFDGSAEIRLPEEDSLIAVSETVKHQNFMSARNSGKVDLLPSQETSVDVADKLAALKSVFRDERSIVGGQDGPPFHPSPYDMREPDIPFRHQNIQPSSPQLHPQLNQGGPLVHPLDYHPSNISSQMNYMAPEGIIQHDPPVNQQFPASMIRPPFHHPSSGLSGFDPPVHHAMLQQMHFRPPQLQRGYPGGPPLPTHSNNQVAGFMQEVNPMHGFPFGQRQPQHQPQPQPNFGVHGMPPGHDVGSGSHHPEALQRLIEMELRSNSKQIHPFNGAGHRQGMYGHELDMGFRYR